MSVSVAVEHNGKTYAGQIAEIKSTAITWDDHGVLSAWLHCEFPSGGIGVGGFCLDEPKDREGSDYTRQGTAYGLDHLMRLMETVGVSTWEKLPGQKVIVLFDGKPGDSTWGRRSVGIAGVLNGKVLVLAEHADQWLAAAGAA